VATCLCFVNIFASFYSLHAMFLT